MRITFVLPINSSGGGRVVATYAKYLASRGHEVVLVSQPSRPPRGLLDVLRRRPPSKEVSSPFDSLGLEHRVLERARAVRNRDVPDADVVIATWWETAEWVAGLAPEKGAKVYFVQGHEIYPWLPQKRCRATYRLPLRKIVVSRWLLDIMREEYGDSNVDLVPNGVDHDVFFAPPRNKQGRPTVGLLHSSSYFKGFALALSALTRVREDYPDLLVLTFGLEHPGHALPTFVEFFQDPGREQLRSLYASCDVWVTASSSEGFNLPAIEAMACRTPVVATRTGWPADVIVEGTNGALVEIGDVEGLAREVSKLLALPTSEWERISAGAFDTVRDCSWARSAREFEEALRQVAPAC